MAATVSCFQSVSYPNIATKISGFCGMKSSDQKLQGGVKFCSLKHKVQKPHSGHCTVGIKASVNEQPSTKKNSVICADCDGNGAVPCSQCKGKGINSVDHFNGQFKAGDSCWLCGGKKNMLCGNCNGAGFIGGFMTSSDT